MLTFDDLAARRTLIEQSPDLVLLRDQLVCRAQPVLERKPIVPNVKALLSRDGGVCPDDGSPLVFDPWSPDKHRCARCSRSFTGERHHAHWARAQHLWIAERAAHLATVHACTGDIAAARRARELLAAYYALYFALPNRDNVLGPSHLFFSTYLESIWILDYLAAAYLLREAGALDDDDVRSIDAIADEAATIIAEFNEGMSNRQTWNSAALTAIATWFGDEELAVTAIEGRTGLLGHLADGFGGDGMWFEGENYHLFALRGLLVGLCWAATAGAELLRDKAVQAHLGEALMAPADTALPDLTFPARKDSRYGVSLGHPSYIECWETGYAMLGATAPDELPDWLRALYALPVRSEQTYDAYLHEAGEPPRTGRTRADLSWWALLTMLPSLPTSTAPWSAHSRLMEQQGLAIMRQGTSYASLECGGGGDGHGHPDRLNLTVHAGGVPWLIDPGTGSYVSHDLFWYRSTLAHNAPLLDGRDQSVDERSRCTAFGTDGDWAWSAGAWNGLRRSVVLGPSWIADMVALDARDKHQFDLPWHLAGTIQVITRGTWLAEPFANEFVGDLERFTPETAGPIQVVSTSGDRSVQLWLAGDGDLLRGTGPGLPGDLARQPFLLRRVTGRSAMMIAVLDLDGAVTAIDVQGTTVRVHKGDRTTTVQVTPAEATIVSGAKRVALGGARAGALPAATFVLDKPSITIGRAIWIGQPPALDGSLHGFDRRAPQQLDDEHQYFRSELAYPGAENLAATAWVNWSDDELFIAVEVVKPDLIFPPEDAPPLALDNEPDDINADGVQIYYDVPDQPVYGWLVRPAPDGRLLSRPLGHTPPTPSIDGGWQRTSGGYRITVRASCPHLNALRRTERIGFDVIVNEMQRDRVRRAGQLIWSGGPGWVYLRGDRHDPDRFGELELLG